MNHQPGDGFPLHCEPLQFQPDAATDPTPPDFAAGAPTPALPPTYWQCSTAFGGCGAIWLLERKVLCPCGCPVAQVFPDLGIWPRDIGRPIKQGLPDEINPLPEGEKE